MYLHETEFENVTYDFKRHLAQNDLTLSPLSIDTLQVNITYMCNQACRHCHVQASPDRNEQMDRRTVDRCLAILSGHDAIGTLDLTGGAPELNPSFEHLVIEARKLGKDVIVRHNLTVTLDGNPRTGESMEHLPEFFSGQQVELACSLPYYGEYFTDGQRGCGVFEKSIESLRRLNSRGYGQEGTGLILNLVYNPAGAFLPADQCTLESDYKKALASQYGITFNALHTITNMPIFRFRKKLKALGALENYWDKLVQAFNPSATEAVMCRNQVSVGYDGRIYDCDFNQVLGLQVERGELMTVFNFDYDRLMEREILVAPHCFGCTAGAGSSCGGSTV
jgi:radical SAM/Cys-rich protein